MSAQNPATLRSEASLLTHGGPRRFVGRVGVVTEPTTQLGRETVDRLAREGADLVLLQFVPHSHDPGAIEAALEALRPCVADAEKQGSAVAVVTARSRDVREVSRALEFCLEEFERLDFAIVLNPSVDERTDASGGSAPEDWHVDLAHATSEMQGEAASIAAHLRPLAGTGSVTLVARIQSAEGTARSRLEVEAIRAGIEAFAGEAREMRVRVNAVLPPAMSDRHTGTESEQDLSGVISAALWLSSSEAETLTGVTLPLDGVLADSKT